MSSQSQVVVSMVILLFIAWLFQNNVINVALAGMKGQAIPPSQPLAIFPEALALFGEYILCALIMPSPWGSIVSMSILAGYLVYHPAILSSLGGAK